MVKVLDSFDKNSTLDDIKDELSLTDDDPMFRIIYYAIRCTEEGTGWRSIACNVLRSEIEDLKQAIDIIMQGG